MTLTLLKTPSELKKYMCFLWFFDMTWVTGVLHTDGRKIVFWSTTGQIYFCKWRCIENWFLSGFFFSNTFFKTFILANKCFNITYNCRKAIPMNDYKKFKEFLIFLIVGTKPKCLQLKKIILQKTQEVKHKHDFQN